jgi:hypothetical protein
MCCFEESSSLGEQLHCRRLSTIYGHWKTFRRMTASAKSRHLLELLTPISIFSIDRASNSDFVAPSAGLVTFRH